MSYESEYQFALNDPEGFWRGKAEELPWFKFPDTVLSQDKNGVYQWFAGGRMNTAWLALDRHVDAGRGDQVALIYDSPVTSKVCRYTYQELTDWVAQVAGKNFSTVRAGTNLHARTRMDSETGINFFKFRTVRVELSFSIGSEFRMGVDVQTVFHQ